MVLRLFVSYVLLLGLSFLELEHILIQRLLLCAWCFYILLLVVQARRTGRPLYAVVLAGSIFQVPGFFLAVSSLFSGLIRGSGTWAPGLLEFWMHPFLCVLELLPPGWIGGTSDVYDVVCSLPLVFVGTLTALWKLADKTTRYPSTNYS